MNYSKTEYFYPDFQLGWKYYNIIRKKAMEQEFSWSGFFVSLSIAFFIAVASAAVLDIAYKKITTQNNLFPNYLEYLADNNFRLAFSASAAGLEYAGNTEKFTIFEELIEGEVKEMEIQIKNTGQKTWKKSEVFLETGHLLKTMSYIKHSSWLKYYQPVGLSSDIAPGSTAKFKFKVNGPVNIVGTIQENFQLVRNAQVIPGTLTRIFIDVKEKDQSSGQISLTAAALTSASEPQTQAAKSADFCITLSAADRADYEECRTSNNEEAVSADRGENSKFLYNLEPMIRVGIFNSVNAQRIGCESWFDVYAGSEILISGVSPASQAIAGFDSLTGKYSVTIGNITKFTNYPLRFVPRTKNAVFTLKDYINGLYYDNQFRHIIELNYSAKTKKMWVINELPLEFYLKGLGETSNTSPHEFQKALIATARTYAMYHYQRGIEYKIPDGSTKHADEHFHIDATNDQVYRGYLAEKRAPKLALAVDSTRGNVLTYNDKIVVTPYFSRSDGRTRDWTEVWGGIGMPWLKSVAVPQDKGQTLWGHGVGMSARGALIMARDENKTWQQILYYFYQGTLLQQVYK